MTSENSIRKPHQVHAQQKIGRPQYAIHEADIQDADQIADIQYASWLETYPSAEIGITVEDVRRKQGDPQVKRERWRKSLLEQKEDGRKTFLVKDGERILGFCVAKKGEPDNEIQAIYLDPKEKGKGAGSLIFEHALRWLGDKKTVKLEVAAHIQNAIHFYERFGFYRDGNQHPYDMGEGKSMPMIDMYRSVKKSLS